MFLSDAKSYSGLETPIDHRPVKAKINIKWYKMKPQKIVRKLDIEKLTNKEERDKYGEKVYEKMKEIKQTACKINGKR